MSKDELLQQLILDAQQKDFIIQQLSEAVTSAQLQFSLLSRCMLDNGIIKQEHIDQTVAHFKVAAALDGFIQWAMEPIRVGPSSPVDLSQPSDETATTADNVVRIFGG